MTSEAVGGALVAASLGLTLSAAVFRLVCMPLWRRRLYPAWAGQLCVPVRELSRWQLAVLATDARLGLIAVVTAAAVALFGAMAAYGAMTPSVTAGACAAFTLYMLLCAWVPFRNGILPLLSLLRQRDFGRRPFRYVDGAWQYIDDMWFIRVGGNTSCALYAPSLDFSRPARYTTIAAFDAGGKLATPSFLPALRVPRVGSVEALASIALDDCLAEWIAAHGGRVSE